TDGRSVDLELIPLPYLPQAVRVAGRQDPIMVHSDDPASVLRWANHSQDYPCYLPHPLGVRLLEQLQILITGNADHIEFGFAPHGENVVHSRQSWRHGSLMASRF